MTTFEQTDGLRLFPKPEYKWAQIEKAETFEELKNTLSTLPTAGRDALRRLDSLDQELRQIEQKECGLEYTIYQLRRLKSRPYRERPHPRKSDETIEEEITDLAEEVHQLADRRQKLQEERDQFAQHLDRNFVAVRVDRYREALEEGE